VRRIHLAIGALSHVDPQALEFGFAAVASGTVAEARRR
jgi:Zn finger protein HypA/HybF involved in hydrogenase expression